MKINLRKSAALQGAIDKQIDATEMPIAVDIDRYAHAIGLVDKEKVRFREGLLKKQELLEVLYSIRVKTALAGVAGGVSELLTKDAYLGKQISLLEGLAKIRSHAKTEAQLNAAQNDLRNEPPVQYAHQRRESFAVSLITENETKVWDKEVAELKRHKQAVSDSLLEVNVKTEFELTDIEVAVLKKYGLI